MTSRSFARFASSAAVVVCAASVAACGLLYGFDRYDTDVVPAALDGGTLDETAASGDFELVVADALRIEPGTSSPLVVELKRAGGSSERVVVLFAEPLPAGLVRAPPATLEPDVSSTTVTVAALADAPVITQTLHLTATSATRTRTKDVSVTLRGLPCNADRQFGPDVPGSLIFTAGGKAPVTVLGLVASAGTITAGLGEPLSQLYRLDATGHLTWDRSAPSDTLGISVDATLGVEIATSGTVLRLRNDGSRDFAYGGTVPAPCTPGAVVQGASAMTIVCADATAAFKFARFDASGAAAFGDPIPFGFGSASSALSASAAAGSTVACGHADDGSTKYGAFARWLPSGQRDEAFGTSGGVRLDTAALAGGGGIVRAPIACVSDDAGVVGLLAADSDRVLVGLTPTGSLDSAFGAAGILPLHDLMSTPVDAAALAFDQGAVLVAASTSAGTFVARYSRVGRLDTTFGVGGYCPVVAVPAAESVSAVTLTADHKLLILTTAVGQARLSSIWL